MKNKTCGECKCYSFGSCTKIKDVLYLHNTNIACIAFEPQNPTLFDRITESPEVLAPKFVYYTVNRDQFGTYYWYCSALIPGEKWSEEAEAIAATVAKLKEVENV